MRYKAIYFYLPMNQAMLGSRIHHFEVRVDMTAILPEHPGPVYTEVGVSDRDGRYDRLGNTDIYRSFTTDYPSNFFVKIVEESDPMFNFDWAYIALFDEDVFSGVSDLIERTYTNLLVPQFVGDRVLNMER